METRLLLPRIVTAPQLPNKVMVLLLPLIVTEFPLQVNVWVRSFSFTTMGLPPPGGGGGSVGGGGCVGGGTGVAVGSGVVVKVGVTVAGTVAVAELVAVGVRIGVTEGVAVGVTLPVGIGVGEGGTQIGPAVTPMPTSGPFTPTCVVPIAQCPFTATVKTPCSNPAPTAHLSPVK